MSTFATPKDAKAWLIARVREQASNEGIELSPVQEYGLSISVDDAEFDENAGPAFDQVYGRLEDFEQWAIGVLERAHARDRDIRLDLAELWQDAYSVLRQEDHSLVVLLKPVLPPGLADRLKRALLGWHEQPGLADLRIWPQLGARAPRGSNGTPALQRRSSRYLD